MRLLLVAIVAERLTVVRFVAATLGVWDDVVCDECAPAWVFVAALYAAVAVALQDGVPGSLGE